MAKHAAPSPEPIGPGPHPSAEESQDLADSFEAQWSGAVHEPVRYPAIANYEATHRKK